MFNCLSNLTCFRGESSFMKVAVFSLLILSLVMIFSSGTAHAADEQIYVNGSSGNDTNDGYSWLTAKQTIGNATGTVASGGTVTIANGTYNGTGNVGISITKDMTITGVDQNGTIIDGGGSSQIFTIAFGVTVTIENLTLTQGYAYNGGAIYNSGDLTIQNCNLTKNTATKHGGGIYNVGTCTVNGSAINNNTATSYGGGIYNYNTGTCTVTDSNIENNISHIGGGITNDGTCTVTDSTITSNTTEYGGGIYNYINSTFTVTDSDINNNTAPQGGGIFNFYGTLNVSGCNFESNQASYGNAIYNYSGDTSTQVVQFCRFYDQADGYEIYCYHGTVDAQYNWWGSNSDPSSKVWGDVDVSPWLVLNIADASPIFIGKNGSSNITANLWYDSDGNYHNPTSEHIADGIPIIFYSTIGIVYSPISTTNGSAVSTLIPNSVSGKADIFAILDDQYLQTSVIIDATSPTVTAIDPEDNAVINDTSKVVTVTFSESVQKGSAYDDISITCNGTPISVVTNLTYNILTITNTGSYTDGTYTINIPADAVIDSAGNGIDSYTSQFTVDTIPPVVTAVDPVDGVVINDTSQVVTVTFSEDILEGTSFDDIRISLNGTPLTTITKTINGNILTLTNTTSYTDGTYTLNIPADAVVDAAGNALETSFSSVFTIDTIAPTIISIDPADGTVLNDTSKVVTVTFSEDILEGTSFDDISISLNGTALTTITKSISGNVLTLTNTASYTNGTYTINIPVDAVVDAAGNSLESSFSSLFTVDTVVPVISSTDPVNGATNLSDVQVITVTFSEPIKEGTSWFELINRNTGTAVDFTTSINGNVLTITPTSDLSEGWYKVIVHTGSVTDLAGNMVAVKSFTFSVGTSPTIISTTPLDGATDVNVAKTITVTFSEAIRKSSHFWAELVDSTGNAVAYTSYITGGNMLVINPTGDLAAGTTYTVKLHTGCVTDLAGNPVAPYIFSFTTRST